MAATGYVIVGGSAAGMAAAQAIRELDRHGSVTILSAEADQPYYRPLIPFVVDGRKTADQISLQGRGAYTAPGIQVLREAAVTAVDAGEGSVTIRDGRTVPYLRLLIATGSRPHLPPDLEGVGTPGVFALRTLADARALAARAAGARSAVLAGGGLLNLKTAFALLERKLPVTMVVTSPEILSQVMEPDGADLIRQALGRAGLRIITGRSVSRVLSGPDGVTGVVLDDGRELDCQIVCVGKGVRPNVEFLQGSGLRLDGGVVADRNTACNLPGIFTAGDVAVTFDSITGRRMMTALWTNAVEMGRCAGRNMAGQPTAYAGTFGILNATQVADVPFVSMGIVHTAGTDFEVHAARTAGTYRKLVFSPDGRRLVGAVLVGDIGHAGLYRHLIRERAGLDGFKPQVVGHRLHYGHFLRL